MTYIVAGFVIAVMIFVVLLVGHLLVTFIVAPYGFFALIAWILGCGFAVLARLTLP